MEVITTISGLKAYGSSYPYTIGYAGFQRKPNAYDFHAGHKACLDALRAQADKVLVGFTNDEEIFGILFNELGITYPDPDKDVCLAWAEDNNVDLVFWPDPGEMASLFDSYDVPTLKNWASTYCTDHGFVLDNDADMALLQSMMIIDKIRVELNLERRDYRVGSWKDGVARLYHKYYTELENYYTYILVPALIDPSLSAPYSHERGKEFVAAKAVLLGKIPAIISTHKSFISTNISAFQSNVKSDIDVLDSNGEFYTIKVNVYYDQPYVEPGYAYIEVVLHLSSKFYSGMPHVEGRYIYPFYEAI